MTGQLSLTVATAFVTTEKWKYLDRQYLDATITFNSNNNNIRNFF